VAGESGVGNGTTMVGSPMPMASLSRPRARVWPMSADYFVDGVEGCGATITVSGGGRTSVSSRRLYSLRTLDGRSR